MGFFVCMKREWDEKGTAEPPSLHTGFHFEFHSFKEETLFIATPQSHFVRQLPGRGAFWHCASTNYKPALKGEVDMSASEWTEGLKKKDASLVYVNPSVTT